MKCIVRVMACSVVALILAAPAGALELGDQAPPLAIKEWIKGKPVDLENVQGSKVVVLEFWATWCGPCRASIPYLTELQQKFQKEVIVIGATREDPNNTLKNVQRFVRRQGDKMGYTIAFDGGATARSYMAAMGMHSIPTAFVIDKEGRLVWVGSPFANLEEVVVRAIGGKIDLALMKKIQKARRAKGLALKLEDWPGALEAIDKYEELADPSDEELEELDWQRFDCLAKNRRTRKKGRSFGEKLVQRSRMAPALNEYAWEMLTDDDYRGKFDALALAAAEKANKLTGGKEADIIDTLARARFVLGDMQEAIRLQKQAIGKADEDEQGIYEETLEEYEEGAEQ